MEDEKHFEYPNGNVNAYEYDRETRKRRDKFLKECRDNIEVIKNEE